MRVLLLTIILLVADQVTKLLVKGVHLPGLGVNIRGFGYGESVSIFGDWCKLTYIENPNMAFGLEIGGKLFLSIFAIIASLGMLYYLYLNRRAAFRFRLALALILAGAVGNLIDRVFYGVLFNGSGWFDGNVVDFIDFDLFVINAGSFAFKFWPIFNIADVAVSAGVVLLLFTGFPKHALSQTASAAAMEESVSGGGQPGELSDTSSDGETPSEPA